MRRTDLTSASCTCTEPRKWRLVLVDFLVRMWRLNAWPRLIDPLLRIVKRLAALFLVFIFGTMASIFLPPQVAPVRSACQPGLACKNPSTACTASDKGAAIRQSVFHCL